MSDGTTRQVHLGPCDCPAQPHAEGDVAILKKGTALKYGDTRRVGAAMATEGGNPLEGGISMAVLMVRTIVSWNKVRQDPRGRLGLVSLPIGLESIDNLSAEQSRAIIAVLNEREYMDHFFVPAAPSAGPAAEASVDDSEGSVQTPNGSNGVRLVSEVGEGSDQEKPLAAPPPPNHSSGPSADGSAALTPSTTSSASPAPI